MSLYNLIRRPAAMAGLFLASVMLFTSCGSKSYSVPFDVNTTKSAFRFETNNSRSIASSFAEKLAVVSGDMTPGEEISFGEDSYGSAILVNVDKHEVMYSRNATAQLYPASMTKVLTAVVALENASLDTVLTANDNCVFTAGDVQKIGLKPGDTMTLDQALHLLLIYSANDVAALIAENIGGSIEGFSTMMNAKARELGATNSNFVNPHGLHDEQHYTTAYDMYLIFNEAIKNDTITQIIGMNSYTTSYKNSAGEEVTFSCDTTNRYLKGLVTSPSNVTVVGGKTGTTIAAGACLVQLSRDSAGRNYITCVMKGNNIDVTYSKTNSLLSMIDSN